MNSKLPKVIPALLVCLIMTVGRAPAGEKEAQEGWKKVCRQVINLSFPAADQPGGKNAAALDQCSSYELYYGFDAPAEPEQARLCAYDEMKKNSVAGPFDGRAMLMTIYANGVGAGRNFDLAIKLACGLDGAPAEMEGRIAHLVKLKEENWQGNDFSLCDDVTSGYLAGFCTEHDNKFAAIKRLEKIEQIQENWTETDKQEYAALRKTVDQYIDIHTEKEVEQSGTARLALTIGETSSQEEEFIKTLEMLEQGKAPVYSHQQFKEADSRLNAVYREARKAIDPEWGTVTREGIRDTQRVWLEYRDAWVRFCLKKYPRCTSDSIKTLLTLKRIKDLENIHN